MKTRSPFLALVKFELFRLWHNFGTPGYLMWVMGFIWGLMPTILLTGGFVTNRRNYGEVWLSVLIGVWAVGWLFGWLFMLGFQNSFALMREARSVFPLSTVPNDNSDEFVETRAVNPRIRFRAKTLALVVIMVGPLLMNVAVSLRFTDYTASKGDREFQLDKIWPQRLFPNSENGVRYLTHSQDAPVKTKGFVDWFGPFTRGEDKSYMAAVIAHGPTVFTVWLIWAAVAAITFVQAYYGLISKLLVERNRRLATFAAALMPLASLLAIPFFLASDQELFHEAFICFASYWLPLTLALGLLAIFVQRFCERRFAEQEVL